MGKVYSLQNKITFFLTRLTGMLCVFACKSEHKKNPSAKDEPSFIENLQKLPDSIKIKGIVIKNLFKSQILAHKGKVYDSSMIIDKVYRPHQKLWDNCYAMILGDGNAPKFNTESGMIAWNDTLYLRNKDFFDDQATTLLEMDFDSVIDKKLAEFNKVVPFEVNSTISILFAPIPVLQFGGCTNDQFAIELNNDNQDIGYTLNIGLPHELNHMAYDPLRAKDPRKNDALRRTTDEGFACYFTWVFLDKEISKHEAVEDMSQEDWGWYLENEKDMFIKLKPYFSDQTGDNPLFRNEKYKLFPDAPKTLFYWMGFRIIENYVNTHGEDSWRDIYKMDVGKVLEESKYEEFIDGLD